MLALPSASHSPALPLYRSCDPPVDPALKLENSTFLGRALLISNLLPSPLTLSLSPFFFSFLLLVLGQSPWVETMLYSELYSQFPRKVSHWRRAGA